MPNSDGGARDRIREHFVACFRVASCDEPEERRHRIIKGLLDDVLVQFDKLISLADRLRPKAP
jgi:hypothetical protein